MSISVLFVIFFAFVHFFIFFFCVVIKHVLLFFTRVAHHLFYLFSFVCLPFYPSLFFVVDNQAFGSDKGKSLAKDQSDVISLDDRLVDKLGA
jgi:hypothetical protein